MTYTFERTADYALVELILSNPRAYALVANDDAPPLESLRVKPGNYTPILCRAEDGMLVGLFMLVPQEPGIAEVHFCFVPGARYQMIPAGKAFIEWAWRETSLIWLLGPCPSYNRLALRTARRCGFDTAWTESSGLQKDGRPFRLIVTAVRRPD